MSWAISILCEMYTQPSLPKNYVDDHKEIQNNLEET